MSAIPTAVLDFINERPDYVTAMKRCLHNPDDYNRWAGHAEARRRLASSLGLTVPHHPGEKAEPAVAIARVLGSPTALQSRVRAVTQTPEAGAWGSASPSGQTPEGEVVAPKPETPELLDASPSGPRAGVTP